MVLDRAGAAAVAARLRALGKRVAFTNGCFDVLHAGHVALLRAAREAADALVVGVNDDAGVRRLKGPGRPVHPLADRAEVLAAIRWVDHVAVFAEETPLALVEAVRPDVMVKGGDYAEEEIVGAREVRGWGGTVLRVPLVEGRSTTAILAASGGRS